MDRFAASYDNFQLLGSGMFGTVYTGKHIPTNENVIIKCVTNWSWAEVTALIACKNIDGVVKLKEFFSSDAELILIMIKIPECKDLFDFIDIEGFLAGNVAQRLFSQLVSAVSAMFDIDLIHGDLKLENCVIDLERLTLTLIDFGSVHRVSDEPFDTPFGTVIYTPPEAFKQGKFHSMSSTVWALGVMLFEMMTGTCPFKETKDILKPLKGLEFVCNDDAEQLITRCLEPDPEKRISLSSILAHAWLN